jgi:hypothetical protein
VKHRGTEASVPEELTPDSMALVEWTEGWEIQEPDHGSVLVFHHHQDGSHAADLRTDAWGTLHARCSGCGLTFAWHSSEGVSFA